MKSSVKLERLLVWEEALGPEGTADVENGRTSLFCLRTGCLATGQTGWRSWELVCVALSALEAGTCVFLVCRKVKWSFCEISQVKQSEV